jgi:hypothetical protein
MSPEKYLADFSQFARESIQKRPEINHYYEYPCLNDDTHQTSFDAHYVYHIAWALRQLARTRPKEHLDISSSIYFNIASSAITKVVFADIRPAEISLDNLEIVKRDLSKPEQWLQTTHTSVSCMHVVEHIGLGRYGDTVDANGDLKAIQTLKTLIATGGQLLFVVPVGKPAVHFNAHRVYRARHIEQLFLPDLRLESFTLIPGPISSPPIENCRIELADDLNYGCGCFLFKKIIRPSLANQES